MGRSRGEGGRGHNRGRGPRWRPRAFRPLLGEGEPQDPSRLRPGSLGAGRGSRCPGGQEWARVIPACRTVLRAPGRGGSRACSPGRGPHSWSCPLRPAQPCGVAGCSELVGAQATVWRDEDRPQVLGVSEDRGWGLGRWDPLGAQAQGPGGSGCQGPSASAGAAPRSVLPSLAVGVETPPPKAPSVSPSPGSLPQEQPSPAGDGGPPPGLRRPARVCGPARHIPLGPCCLWTRVVFMRLTSGLAPAPVFCSRSGGF